MRKIFKRRSARVAVWAAGGVLGAGAIGLLAAPATASTPTVSYDGGCSVLSSTSSPDDDSLSVRKPAGGGPAEVKVVNDMNAPATPYANGKAVTTSNGKALVIDDGDSATIPFASGPVDLVLKPKCGLLGLDTSVLKKDYDAARISVLRPATGGGSGDSGGSDSGGGTESGSNGGSTGGSGDSGSETGDRPAAPKDPVARGADPDAADGEAPDSGDSADGNVGAPAGGDDNNKAGGNGDAAPIVNASHNRGPGTTTLALIAAVCLLGVGAAAFRTILVTRAARVSYN